MLIISVLQSDWFPTPVNWAPDAVGVLGRFPVKPGMTEGRPGMTRGLSVLKRDEF